MRRLAIIVSGAAMLLWQAGIASADGGYSGAVSFVRGQSVTSEAASAVYIFNSVDVSRGRLRVTATLPLVSQETIVLVVPTTQSPSWNGGLGDPTLRADVRVAGGGGRPWSLSVGGAVKFPVADVDDGLGSGEYDGTVGVTLLTGRGRHSFLLDVSYWLVGDMPDAPQRDVPAVYAGYAAILDGGRRWSAILAIASAGSIVEGLDPPTQLSVGILRALGSGAGLGATVGIGLTESASDFSISASWRIGF